MSTRLEKVTQRKVTMLRHQRDQSSMSARVECGKVAYASKGAAKRAVKSHGYFERVYRCSVCGAWHLTSQQKALR